MKCIRVYDFLKIVLFFVSFFNGKHFAQTMHESYVS